MLNKIQKEEIVSNYKDSFSTTPSFLLINFKGARVSEFEKLRNKLRDNDTKLSVVKKIQEYTAGGGFLFAMCSATDTYDIALSAHKTDICEYMFDGDPIEKNAQDKLTFIETFAFENFEIILGNLTMLVIFGGNLAILLILW